jgi:hypothetical protein
MAYRTDKIPEHVRRQVLEVFQEELQSLHSQLRTCSNMNDMLRLQGKAQFVYGWITALTTESTKVDGRKEGEKPNGLTGY